ncbi:MAG: ArnT family glycosyltransferase [Candidatus Binataceae bacterium]
MEAEASRKGNSIVTEQAPHRVRHFTEYLWAHSDDLGMLMLAGLALVIIWGVSRVEYFPHRGFHIVAREAISGDAPHYLIIVNSLLFDHSFEVQNAYDRVANGGLDAGARFRHGLPDHHTILVNRRTGHQTLWKFYLAGNTMRNPLPEFRAGPDVYEVPAHPVAFPALMAILLMPFHPPPDHVESDVGLLLVLIGWAGTLATYLMARRGGFGRGPALIAAGILLLASPWLAYSRDYFTETTIGLCLALAIWAWTDDRPIVAALFAAGAMLIKPPFALVGAGFVIEALREWRLRDAVKMALTLGVFGLALCGFNYWLAGTPVIAGAVAWQPALNLEALRDTLIHPEHGLVVFAPWTVFAVFPIGIAFDRFDAGSAMLRRMAWPLILFLVLLSITNFGPGYCYGPRYWVPFLPWLAVATVQALRFAGLRGRIVCALLILIGVAIAIPGTLQLPQMYSKPPSAAWQAIDHLAGLDYRWRRAMVLRGLERPPVSF